MNWLGCNVGPVADGLGYVMWGCLGVVLAYFVATPAAYLDAAPEYPGTFWIGAVPAGFLILYGVGVIVRRVWEYIET